MQFNLSLQPKPLEEKIEWLHPIFLMGSCFTESMSAFLSSSKFSTISNPNGTIYNPISMFNALNRYAAKTYIEESELVELNGLWSHWDYHTSFSHPVRSHALQAMNSSIENAHDYLIKAEWLMLTLGTGYVYQTSEHGIVANCHKCPQHLFNKRLLTPQEVMNDFEQCYHALKKLNPRLKFILTVSPVRHKRDGLIENNRSKAVLFLSIDQLTALKDVVYFPAYELVVDDLRDYRFYAEDLVHPNDLAKHYVWEKFKVAAIDEKTREAMKQVDRLTAAMSHRPLHPETQDHLRFLSVYFQITKQLSQEFPFIDFSKELRYFSGN